MTPVLSVKSLRVDYAGVVAVDDFSLELPAGAIYGLVGPNGAGKTSAIKAIAGIIEPTYGAITIDGFDSELKRDDALRRLGYMPDFAPVYERLKVWEYLDVFAAAYQIPSGQRASKVGEWMERVDLTSKSEALINTLSRGMRQRLVLAKTLLTDPSLILLDEPASGLDPIARMDMRNVLKLVASMGKTIVISSHVLTELSEFCNAVGIMEKGRLIVSGTMDEIRHRLGSTARLIIRGPDHAATLHIKNMLQNMGLTGNTDAHGRSTHQANANDAKVIVDVSVPPGGRSISDANTAQRGNDPSQGNITANRNASSEGNSSIHGNIPPFADGASISIPFTGTDNDAAQLLQQLIAANARISEFRKEQDSMEDIFFKVGAREVS